MKGGRTQRPHFNDVLSIATFFIVWVVGHATVQTLEVAPLWLSTAFKTSSSPRAWTVDLHPTASLNRRRRILRQNGTMEDELNSYAKPHHNAIYAAIPDLEHPDYHSDSALREFYTYRHLSRFERSLREENDFDLHLDWNGEYDDEFSERSQHSKNATSRFFSTVFGGQMSGDEPNQRSQPPNNATSRRFLSTVFGGQMNNYQSVPLSQGYGTHFANIWVGSPTPQRKTVIVDTGSHYTAFPCSGCRNCGATHHTDPYFEPSKSATFHELQCDECLDGVMCKKGKCRFRQAYTEGSSWEAIQVKDQFYCGGTDVLDSADPADQKYRVEFMFGCQEKTSGQFITQLADGIMGMSAHPATLVKILHDAKKIEYNMFAMCFRRELGTSKRGVSAGSMTFGGFSNTLDTTPMIYAKNMAKIGWFTVYVKNIFIRTTGGQSAKSIDPVHRTVRVAIDVKTLNSGKGVIVDSGTTDTYLNKKVAKQFARAWQSAMGQTYSHAPMALTAEQLRRLPTILIQCQAYSLDQDPSVEDYDSISGFTGSLDPTSPKDLLIAIPATSYMDYSAITNEYMSRLYFTETMGGVLGSNTMQGHNVLFDWQNGRVGFAESSCTYDKKDVPEVADDPGFPSDCEVGEPILTKPCIETVDSRVCKINYHGIKVIGNETWTAVVEGPGNDAGVSCTTTARSASGDTIDSDKVVCDGEGLCEETRSCELTCAEADAAKSIVPAVGVPKGRRKTGLCGDSGWSACDYNCMQTRVISHAYSDGHCHEQSRKARVCHTGACAHADPCKVPFLVHTVMVFRGGSPVKWSRDTEEALATAMELAFERHTGERFFTAGDVNVAMALPWYRDPDEMESSIGSFKDLKEDITNSPAMEKLGLRVIIEISMFNPLVDKRHNAEVGSTYMRSVVSNITDKFRGKKYECTDEELFPLARNASRTKVVLSDESFFRLFVEELEGMDSAKLEPFGPLKLDVSKNTSSSRVLTVWTIRTRVEDEVNFNGPPRPLIARLLSLLQILLILTASPFVLASLGNGIQIARDFFVGYNRHGRRFFARTPEPSNNPSDVESSIILGTESVQVTYKVTRPSKRNRSLRRKRLRPSLS